ncbi:MAG: cytochrome P450 [Rhodothermales bacterium]
MPFFTKTTYPARFPGQLLLEMQRDPLGTFGRMAATGGALVQADTGLRPFYLVADPELVKELLTTPTDAFTKSPILQRTKVVLGEGLLTSEDPLHRQHRKLILPAFHHHRLRAYADTMTRLTERTAAGWHDGEVFALDREMMRLTLEIAAETLFGAHVEWAVTRISRALDTAMRVFRRRMMNPFADALLKLPLPDSRRVRRARADLDRVVYGIIEARRAERRPRPDLLGLLLEAQDEDTGAHLTDAEVRDEVMTLFLAGHETTANALTWTHVLLARHPDVAARLHAEVDAVLGDRPATFDDLRELGFTRQVFSEALRLYPPAWAISRLAVRDTVLGGHRIPEGSILTISPYVLHHDARLWANPETFDPDRFAPEADIKRHKFAFLPFSAGPRGCIGEQFAWMEGVLVTATLAQRWRLRLADDQPIPLQPSVTLRPGRSVPVIAHRREPVSTEESQTLQQSTSP